MDTNGHPTRWKRNNCLDSRRDNDLCRVNSFYTTETRVPSAPIYSLYRIMHQLYRIHFPYKELTLYDQSNKVYYSTTK